MRSRFRLFVCPASWIGRKRIAVRWWDKKSFVTKPQKLNLWQRRHNFVTDPQYCRNKMGESILTKPQTCYHKKKMCKKFVTKPQKWKNKPLLPLFLSELPPPLRSSSLTALPEMFWLLKPPARFLHWLFVFAHISNNVFLFWILCVSHFTDFRMFRFMTVFSLYMNARKYCRKHFCLDGRVVWADANANICRGEGGQKMGRLSNVAEKLAALRAAQKTLEIP